MAYLSRLRYGLGLLALGALLFLGFSQTSLRPDDAVTAPAVVESSAIYRLSPTDPSGYVGTLLRTGVEPGLSEQEVVRLSGGDRLRLTLAPGLAAGSLVKAGDVLAELDSGLASSEVDALKAERAMIEAQRALIAAGGRAETIAAARAGVDVAAARLAETRALVERLEPLVASGAAGSAELIDAKNLAAVLQKELEQAKALYEESKLPPRKEELAALDAQIAGVDSRLAQAEERQQASALRSPIDGVLETSFELWLFQVVATDPVLLRVPVAQEDWSRVAVGDALTFTTPARPGQRFNGTITTLGRRGQPLTGRMVLWAMAELADADGLSPGMSGLARIGDPR